MMATTDLEKIPETVRSRAQIFEFKTIATRAIADQLRKIADAERITIAEDALLLIARNAEGSMRDAQSALDQVIAFSGTSVSAADVSTVLGLVGRDWLLGAVTAVADGNASAAFELAARAVEDGHDLRRLCNELSRLVRDLLVLSIDSGRFDDPEIAAESDRPRLRELVGRFSREDLLRAFDVLTEAELEIRQASEPRYHLEMALLRWIHLRKIVPIEQLIAQLGAGAKAVGPMASQPASRPPAAPGSPASRDVAVPIGPPDRAVSSAPVQTPSVPTRPGESAPGPGQRRTESAGEPVKAPGSPRDAFLGEIERTKSAFFRMVVAQAQKIEFLADQVVFTFLPHHRTLREQVEQHREFLEALASRVAGRKMRVSAMQSTSEAGPGATPPGAGDEGRAADLKARAMADPGVQALLEMFPAEIRDVEEIKE